MTYSKASFLYGAVEKCIGNEVLSKGNEWQRDVRVKSGLVKHCTGKVRKSHVPHWHRRVMYSFAQA